MYVAVAELAGNGLQSFIKVASSLWPLSYRGFGFLSMERTAQSTLLDERFKHFIFGLQYYRSTVRVATTLAPMSDVAHVRDALTLRI